MRVARGTCVGAAVFAADDTPLVGVMLGTGQAGIVLAHGSGGDLCEWLPYASERAAAGYRVLAYDARPGLLGVDLDAEAAVEAIRRAGAQRVAIAGSSLGALAAIVAGASLWTPPDAIVSLSAPDSVGPMRGLEAAPRLRAPVFFLAAEDDAPFSDAARSLYAEAPGPVASRLGLVVRRGPHAVDSVQWRTRYASQSRATCGA